MNRMLFFLTLWVSLLNGESIWLEDFSTAPKYTVTLGAEGHDGSADYFIRTDDEQGHLIGPSYSGASGYFFAGQDIDDGGWTGSANPSQLTWSGIAIEGATTLAFEGKFASIATDKIDETDYLKLEYRIDSGSWVVLLAFENDGAVYNTNFLEDTDLDGIGDGDPLSPTMQTFTKSIGSTGTSLDIRFTAAVNAGGEDFAIDDFRITGNDSSLPVELSTWSGTWQGGTVQLHWSTQSEYENQGFIIERRKLGGVDAIQAWEEIANYITQPALQGQGSTTSHTDYSFQDSQVTVGDDYRYRLGDVDYQGDVTYHDEILVTARGYIQSHGAVMHQAYPNPFNDDIQFSVSLESDVSIVTLSVFDLQGGLIKTLCSEFQDWGNHDIRWDGRDGHGQIVPSGIYLIQLTAGPKAQYQRVTLLR